MVLPLLAATPGSPTKATSRSIASSRTYGAAKITMTFGRETTDTSHGTSHV
jgi:hypothetical protein